jgi:hypothetical protein
MYSTGIADRSRKMFIWMVTKYILRLDDYRMYSTGIADRSRRMIIWMVTKYIRHLEDY